MWRWKSSGHERISLICRDTACKGADFDELQDKTVWYLVDAVEPLPAMAKMVASASFSSHTSKVSICVIHNFARHAS